MRKRNTLLYGLTLCTIAAPKTKARCSKTSPSSRLKKVLRPETVVVVPIGAESKEHGTQLLLKNDFLIAGYLKNRCSGALALRYVKRVFRTIPSDKEVDELIVGISKGHRARPRH